MVFSPLFGLTHRHLKKPKGLAASKAKKRELQLGWILPPAWIEFRTLEHTNGVLSTLNFESKQFRILVLY